MHCYTALASPQPAKTNPVWEGHTTGAIYLCTLIAAEGNVSYQFWSPAPPAGLAAINTVVLAQDALKSLTVPSPSTGRYPAGTLRDGQPYTVVSAYTWFWSDPGTFRVLTARANAGAVWAQVTVTPTRLSFTPGDGSPAVSCAGPGVAWTPADGVWSPSPVGCDYRYRHSSIHDVHAQVTATYTITWAVTWTSSTGATGTLPALDTTTTATFAVAEVEAVVTR